VSGERGTAFLCFRFIAGLRDLSTTYLMSRRARPLALVFFFKSILTFLGLLNFPVNFTTEVLRAQLSKRAAPSVAVQASAVSFVFQLFRRAGR
jgi:hypothetical protein